jgi:type IV pilus assembly protein PilM
MRLFPARHRGTPAAAPQSSQADPGVQYRPVRQAFGLDISDASLKAVEFVRQKGAYVLRAHSSAGLAPDIVRRGEIVNPPALETAIRDLLKNARPRPITTRHVLLSFPETNVYLHPFEFPNALSETQVRRAVQFEAEGELPINLRDMYTDVQFHRSREKAHHVLFAAASQKLIDAYLRVLVSAGLLPVVFEVESLSVARCLVRTQENPVLLLDLGASFSTISTVERGTVHGAVSIPVGGITLTDMIAGALSIPPEKADAVKKEQGLEGLPPAARDVLVETLTPVIEETRKSAAYHEQHTGRPVAEVILSGGTALLKGIVPLLAERTKLTVAVGDPFAAHAIRFSAAYKEPDTTAFSDMRIVYANSIGLALRGATTDFGSFSLNLLPPTIKLRYLRWKEQAVVAALSSVTALIVLATVSVYVFWGAQLFLEREAVAQEAAKTREAFSNPKFEQASRAVAEANSEITILRQFESRRMDVGELIASLRAVVPPAVHLETVTVVFGENVTDPVTVKIGGTAARREDFLAFEKALRAHPRVTNVDSPITNLNQPVNASFVLTLTVMSKALASPDPAIP